MGVKFGQAKGDGKKSLDQYEIRTGANAVRIFGDLLPRYLYWVKGTNDKNVPIECLDFDRDQEQFTNKEKNWVKEFYPDIKSNWAYSIQCIDLADNKVKIFNLKKKLTDQILAAVSELGDPTDPETGWEVHFSKKKTGPHQYNVEYTLDQIKCLKNTKPLTDEQKALVEAATPIDELLPRPSADQQKEFLERIASGGSDESNEDKDTLSNDFDVE